VSPPARTTPCWPASLTRPLVKAFTQDCDRSRGRARDRKAATGSPPMAAMSLNPLLRQRWPTAFAGCQSRRKWIFSRVKSVVTSESSPAGNRITAQSSPIPAMIAGPDCRLELAVPRPVSLVTRDSSMLRKCAICDLSGSGMAPYYTVGKALLRRTSMGKFPAVTCTPDRYGYPIFRNFTRVCTSLTGGTYFVTVNQSFTKDLWPG
jgi:hypothetical protein